MCQRGKVLLCFVGFYFANAAVIIDGKLSSFNVRSWVDLSFRLGTSSSNAPEFVWRKSRGQLVALNLVPFSYIGASVCVVYTPNVALARARFMLAGTTSNTCRATRVIQSAEPSRLEIIGMLLLSRKA